MTKITKEKTEIPTTSDMNDKDYLNCTLTIQKNMSTNLNMALNEASNEHLYKKIKEIYETIRDSQRELYELAFSKGWYELETAEEKKINETHKKLKEEISQL